MTIDRQTPSSRIPEIEQPLVEAVFRGLFGSCINAMNQDDSLGETLVIFREDQRLHMRQVDHLELAVADLDRYEMILFDGGNTSGDLWKHVFFPRQRPHFFVHEAD